MSDDQRAGVEVQRDVLGRGYVTVVTYDADHALTLDHDRTLAYVETMIAALTRAQYSEAVRSQLGSLNGGRMDPRAVVASVLELRDEWPELPTFGNYEIRPCTSAEGRPSVQVWTGGRILLQFAPHNVAEHVVHVLQIYAAADLDSSYRRYLVGAIGIDSARAAAVISTLGDHIPDKDGINGLDGLPPRARRRRPGRRR